MPDPADPADSSPAHHPSPESAPPDSATVEDGAPLRAAATLVGGVFLLVGVLGFVPGATTDLDQLQWWGHGSGAMLLGLFQVSVLHNAVHLAFGVAGVAAGRRTTWSFGYLVGGGLVYLVLWLYGLLTAEGSEADVVPLNTADDWLHLGLGLGMVALGFAGRAAIRTRVGPSGRGVARG